ncbi:winged helix-turn-helix transcriptional regulator [Salinigranum halophilum]|uniref:winged helix-turn-helix transcriptional regulator n=1 Tax=Salinigranum halophilum TaxID=2565931 RepID=UPI0013762A7A|nr:winged helix-turn-helix transcriptional regulator [Salinigranum halophilum]
MNHPRTCSPDADPGEYLGESAALLSKKWHPHVVRTLAAGDGIGFSDLEDRLDGISAKVLTDALVELQTYQVVERTEVSRRPLRVAYSLTERGHALAEVIDALAEWGETYLAADADEQVVLVAEDNRRLAQMHAIWLEDDYTVRTAHDGDEALRVLDDDVDIVVLDRRMPGTSGDEVLNWIRAQHYDCRVALLTSVEPSFDVVDLDFDAYISKPIHEADLRAVVADLFERNEAGRVVRQYRALESKLHALEAEHSRVALEASDAYGRLRERFESLSDRLDETESVDKTDPRRPAPLGAGGDR